MFCSMMKIEIEIVIELSESREMVYVSIIIAVIAFKFYTIKFMYCGIKRDVMQFEWVWYEMNVWKRAKSFEGKLMGLVPRLFVIIFTCLSYWLEFLTASNNKSNNR